MTATGFCRPRIRNSLRLLMWLCLLSGWCGAPCWAQFREGVPEIVAELDHDQIFLGESVLYRVTIKQVENPKPPRLDGFDAFDARLVADRPMNLRSVQIINGLRSETIRFSHAYDYLLTPREAGQLQVPAPTVTVNGKTLRGKPLSLHVRKPEDQDIVRLEMNVEPPSVYPTQEFQANLTVAIKEIPSPYADRNPLTVQDAPPSLTIPWATDERLPEGLQPVVPWQRWLQPQQARQGFSVNDIGAVPNSILRMFEDRAATFLPTPRRTRRNDNQGRSTGYWEFSFSRRFIATRPGNYGFGPVTLKGTFGTRVGDRLEGERIFAMVGRVDLEVKQVPAEGRPESYVGVVGAFQPTTRLEPREVKVGDPMTLQISFHGGGALESATPPPLAELEQVTRHYRVYDATSNTEDNARTFTFGLRPLSTEVAEFPSIPLSYFDPTSEKFVTIHTEAIPVQVRQASQLASDDIAMAARNGGANRALELYEGGIFPNISDSSALRDQTVHPGRWLAGMVSMAAAYGLVLVGVSQTRRYRADRRGRTRRAAPARARNRLQTAIDELQQGQPRAAADQISQAMIGFVADMGGHSESGLTSHDAHRLLGEQIQNSSLLERFDRLLAACDGARYGAANDAVRHVKDDASALLEDLIRGVKEAK